MNNVLLLGIAVSIVYDVVVLSRFSPLLLREMEGQERTAAAQLVEPGGRGERVCSVYT